MSDALENISRQDLKAKLDRGDDFVLIESLPEEKYREAHLPGALHVSPEEVQDLDKLADWAAGAIPSKDTDVVVYCANAKCTGSDMTAGRLEELGYTSVADYHEGKADWQNAGLPTESGAEEPAAA
jgi:rhodanese-related sulfurtransferase